MNFISVSSFEKQLKKLPKKTKAQVVERLKIFMLDEFSPILNNHKLHGEFKDYHSININGDIRLIYRKIGNHSYYLLAIGTHSELYS